MTAELINTETGEVITAESARESVHRARGNVAGFWREVQWQVTNRAWEVLGYDTFDDLWTAQYAAFEVSIPRNLRPELTASLRSAGQTQQQIADKLGVSERTVRSDQRELESTGNLAGSDQETKITNARGQERPASYQRPRPKPAPVQPRQETPEERERREVEQGRRDTCTRIAECVRFLDGGREYGRIFLDGFYPYEADHLAPGMRLTRARIDSCIEFLQTIREGVDR